MSLGPEVRVFMADQGIRIMPPGTVHCVLTIRDCFAVGGHFYTKWSLGASFEAGIRENLSGIYDTNTQHIASEVILHAMLQFYMQAMHLVCPSSKRLKKPRFRKCIMPLHWLFLRSRLSWPDVTGLPAHDCTLASLRSAGCFDGHGWPPQTF